MNSYPNANNTYPNPNNENGNDDLPNGEIFVGNSSNKAAPVSMTGDTTITNAGVITAHYNSSFPFAIPQTVNARLDQSIWAADAGILPSNSAATNSTRLATLLSYLNSNNGGKLLLTIGTYNFDTTLNLGKNTLIIGQNRQSTILQYTGTGDAILSSYPINSSTAVRSGLCDMTIKCSNASVTGAGFDQIGGTYILLSNILFILLKTGPTISKSYILPRKVSYPIFNNAIIVGYNDFASCAPMTSLSFNPTS